MSLAESIEPDAPRFASAEAFLDWVEAQPEKWELVDGVAVMMAGGSLNHSRLAGNAYLALRTGLRGSRCEAFGSDAAVTLEPGRVGFPDVSVSCDAANGKSVPDPVVIIEVLSPTTQSYDLGDKARAYRKLASLRHLVFVRQDKIAVQHFYRAEAGEEWRLTEIDRVDVPLRLTAVGVEIGMPELYAQVTFG
jgi:Uma2 family endonuclease